MDEEPNLKLIEALYDIYCDEKSYDNGITQYEYKYTYNKEKKKSIKIPIIQIFGYKETHKPFIEKMKLYSSVCIFAYLAGNYESLNNVINFYYKQIKAKDKKCKFICVGIAKNELNELEKKKKLKKQRKN